MKQNLLIFTWMFFVIPAIGQEKYFLSVNRALEVALTNSKQIHSSEARLMGAQSRSGESRAGLLPKITLTGRASKLSEVDPFVIPIPFSPVEIRSLRDQSTVRLSLQQPVFSGFRFFNNYQMSNYNAKATGEDFNKEKADLVLNVKTAYWNVVKLEALARQMDETVEQLTRHVKDVEAFYQQGLATHNDVLKVRVQRSDMQINQIDADNAASLAKLNLCHIMGMPLSTEITPVDSLSFQEVQLPVLDPLLAQALQKRPDIKSMEYRVKMNRSGVNLARAGWYPNLVASVNYDYSRPNTRIFPQKFQFDESWDVTLSLQMNLWDWGMSYYQTRQAQSQLVQTEDALKQMQDAVTLEVTQSYLNLVKSVKAIEVSRLTIEQAEENFKVVSEKFRNGMALNSELLDAETALLSTKTKYINTLADLRIAEAKLQRAVGE